MSIATRFVRPPSLLQYVPDANCVLWLPGQDDPQSSTIRDRSGNGNNGTATGTSWKQVPSTGLWYLYFPGTNDKIDCGTSSTLNPANNMTIKAWVNPTNFTGDNKAILNRDNVDDARSFDLRIRVTTGYLRVAISKTAGGDFTTLEATDACTAAVWQQVGCTYKYVTDGSSEIRIYLNGAEIKNATNAVGPISTTSTETLAGLAGDDSADFIGGMALIEMSSSTWTATQFAGSYNRERHLFGV